MQPRAAALLLAIAFGAIAIAAERSSDLMQSFAKVSLFAFGGVGFAGTIVEGETDYYLTLARPSPQEDFERLFTSGTPAAKCYALVAPYKLNPKRFQELAFSVRTSTAEVTTGRGCILKRTTLGAVIKSIEAGAFLDKDHSDDPRKR